MRQCVGAQLAAGLGVVEVEGVFQLGDDVRYKGAGLHEVVGVDEDLAHHLGGGLPFRGSSLSCGTATLLTRAMVTVAGVCSAPSFYAAQFRQRHCSGSAER